MEDLMIEIDDEDLDEVAGGSHEGKRMVVCQGCGRKKWIDIKKKIKGEYVCSKCK